MKCYELTKEQIALLSMMDETDDADTLKSLFDELQGATENKLEAMAHIRMELKADEAKLKAEIERLQAKKKTVSNNIDNIEKHIIWFLGEMQISKIKTPLYNFSVSKTAGALKIIDEDKIPVKFTYIETETKIKKDELKEALKNGKVIDGIELVISDSLRIK